MISDRTKWMANKLSHLCMKLLKPTKMAVRSTFRSFHLCCKQKKGSNEQYKISRSLARIKHNKKLLELGFFGQNQSELWIFTASSHLMQETKKNRHTHIQNSTWNMFFFFSPTKLHTRLNTIARLFAPWNEITAYIQSKSEIIPYFFSFSKLIQRYHKFLTLLTIK